MPRAVRNIAEIYLEFFETFYAIADNRCRRYVGSDKPHGTAASLQACLAFADRVQRTSIPNPVIVDAGAGASSAVLRYIFHNVISCDPDRDYLHLVRMTCKSMDLAHGEYTDSNVPYCDGCFYDYGNRERIPCMRSFIERTRHVVYIDDAHDRDVAEWATRQARELSWQLSAPHALDEFGRYGILLVK
jgi:hypothetical protein